MLKTLWLGAAPREQPWQLVSSADLTTIADEPPTAPAVTRQIAPGEHGM